MAVKTTYSIVAKPGKPGAPVRCSQKDMAKKKKEFEKKVLKEKKGTIIVSPTPKNATLLGTTLSLGTPGDAVVETTIVDGSGKKKKIVATSVAAVMPVEFQIYINNSIDQETSESKKCYNAVFKHEQEHVNRWREAIAKFNSSVPQIVTKAAKPVEFDPSKKRGKALDALEKKYRDGISAAVRQSFKDLVETARKYSDEIHTEKRYAKEEALCEIHLSMDIGGSKKKKS